jgi:hypothetical protein
VGEGKAIKYAYFNISTDEISENNRNKVLSAVGVSQNKGPFYLENCMPSMYRPLEKP